jgi:muconate cycloisomerase
MKKKFKNVAATDSRIVRIELAPVFMPFRAIAKEAMKLGPGGLGMAIPAEEEWLGGDFAICKLVADDGSIGLGEIYVWLPEIGISSGQVIDISQQALSRYVLGESPFRIERIRHRMDCNVTRCEVPKGLLDMACYDLMGRITGRPASDFMGGAVADEIPLAAMIPLMSPETMVAFGKGLAASGVRTLRVKLGRNINEDVKIMEGIRAAVGKDIRLRVDYNQAYTPAQAVRAIKAIEPFGIDLAEQPVRTADFLGMAYVQKRVSTPLMAHESGFSLTDIITLIELGAVGAITINTERPGGVTNALRAIDYVEQRGLGAVIHNQSLGIGSAVQIHLAAARLHSLGHDTELFGHVMMEDDLIKEEIDYTGGKAKVPAGPGWGVTLDEEALKKYASGPTVVIEKK